MRQISSFAAAALMAAAVAGWLAVTSTRANTVKNHDEFSGRYSTSGPTLPLVF